MDISLRRRRIAIRIARKKIPRYTGMPVISRSQVHFYNQFCQNRMFRVSRHASFALEIRLLLFGRSGRSHKCDLFLEFSGKRALVY